MTNVEFIFNEQLERFYEEVFKRALNSISNNYLTMLLADKLSTPRDKYTGCVSDCLATGLRPQGTVMTILSSTNRQENFLQ